MICSVRIAHAVQISSAWAFFALCCGSNRTNSCSVPSHMTARHIGEAFAALVLHEVIGLVVQGGVLG
jgi:hypothetical protein